MSDRGEGEGEDGGDETEEDFKNTFSTFYWGRCSPSTVSTAEPSGGRDLDFSLRLVALAVGSGHASWWPRC